MRFIFVVTIAGIACALTMAAATPAEDAVAVGQKWLSLLDEKKYEESWMQAGSGFRDEVKQEQWVESLKRSREPLGSLISRTDARVRLTTSLRGEPDGEYAVIHFTTSLQTRTITERLDLRKEDGRWQVLAYAIH